MKLSKEQAQAALKRMKDPLNRGKDLYVYLEVQEIEALIAELEAMAGVRNTFYGRCK